MVDDGVTSIDSPKAQLRDDDDDDGGGGGPFAEMHFLLRAGTTYTPVDKHWVVHIEWTLIDRVTGGLGEAEKQPINGRFSTRTSS